MVILLDFIWRIFVITAATIGGLLLGSIMDKGHRYEGYWRNDLPSTVGAIIGFIASTCRYII